MDTFLASLLGIAGAIGGLVVGHVLSSRVRRAEWAREDERRLKHREYSKRLEFLVDVEFVGLQGDVWIVELLAFVHNKGLVDHTITQFDFDLRCMRRGEPTVEGGDDIGGQVLFPHMLKTGQWLPALWSGTFIEPGLSTKYSYLTSIPTDATFLLLHGRIDYGDERFHTAERVAVVPIRQAEARPGGADN